MPRHFFYLLAGFGWRLHSKNTKGVKLVLDEDQQNYHLGRRIKGEGYPKSAKDKAAWELYHAAGFKEHLNTRVMFKACYDNSL